MKTDTNALRLIEWTFYTARFVKRHFLVIFGLGLLAGLGRAIQLRAFGLINPLAHASLEVVIQGARLTLVCYVIGLANCRKGLIRIGQIIKYNDSRRKNWQVALQTMRRQWLSILVNLGVFLPVAYLLNLLINHIAYETCLYITLVARHIISDQSSEWVLILFFKNVSIVPLTLVFEALFLLWVTNRLPTAKSLA